MKISLRGYQVNVGIVASPAEIESSDGLCGWFDGDMRNDLRLEDGTVITTLTQRQEAPAFSRAWQ